MALDRQQLLQRADRALRGDNLAEAVACYRQLLTLTPNDLGLLQRLADTLARAGENAEARKVFKGLADEYWRAGLGSRALAVLRRAARLGPPDRELLGLLGRRLLEQGLAAEARGSLFEAARMAEAAGDTEVARGLYADIAGSLPKDVSSREALVRLAETAGAPGDRAAALVGLGAARARSGEAQEAFALFAQALDVDPDALTALRGLPELTGALAGVAPDPAPPRELSPTAHAGWTLLAAATAAGAGTGSASAEAAAEILGSGPGAAPRLRLWAAWALLSHGRIGDVAPAVLEMARAHRFDADLRGDLDAVAAAVRLRASGTAVCKEIDDLLFPAQTSATPVSSPTPVASAQPASDEARGVPQSGATWETLASRAAQAKLLEAEMFLKQGLADLARKALAAIPAELQGQPRVAAAAERLAALRAAVAPPVAPDADDEVVTIMLDEDDLPRAKAAPARRPAPRPPARDPRASAGPDDTVDLRGLEASIRDGVDPADAETSYQVAVGLVEMGLAEQALPLLETALRDPARRIDALLLLSRLRVGRGEHDKAYAEATAVIGLTAGAPGPIRAELLAVLADLALRTGRPAEARGFFRELQTLVPDHPAIPDLRGRLSPSRT